MVICEKTQIRIIKDNNKTSKVGIKKVRKTKLMTVWPGIGA